MFYSEYNNCMKANQVLLRHDIDQSISYAYEMAKLEAESKAKSTYFVWLTSPFYNVFDPNQTSLLREIKRMGHDIGLHFDPKAYSNEKNLAMKIKSEAEVLSNWLEAEVTSYSLHRPIPDLLNRSIEPDGLINAYDKVFISDFKYISDSNHYWREKCACHHIGIHGKLHILTHSVWWASKGNKTVIDKIETFKQDLGAYIDRELANNITAYSEYKNLPLIRQSRR